MTDLAIFCEIERCMQILAACIESVSQQEVMEVAYAMEQDSARI